MKPFPTPPAAVQLNLALAADALELAESELDRLTAALADVELQPVCPYAVSGYRATVRLFRRILGGVKLIGPRLPAIAGAVRRSIEDREEDPRKPAGLERSAAAIFFAIAELEEAYDAMDALNGDLDLHDAIEAGCEMLTLIMERLERPESRVFGDPGMN